MAVHHIVATVSTALGLYAGYGLNGVCNLLYLMEFSTPALNYRTLYEKKDFGNCMPQMLQLIFFIKFTIFRIVLLPYSYYRLYEMYPEVIHAMPQERQYAFWGAYFLFGIVFIMNYYWYFLMLRGIGILLGLIKKDKDFEA